MLVLPPENGRFSPRLRDFLIAIAASLLVGAVFFNPIHPILAIGLALAPLAVLFAMRNVFLFCLGFVIFSFFRIHEAFPVLMPLRIPQLLAIPTLGVLVWQVWASRELKPYWSRDLTVFAVFFGLVTLGVLFASNRPTAIAYWTATYVKIGIMVFAIAWLTRQPKDFALASRAFVIAGFTIACVALYNKANGIGLIEGTRVTISRDIRSVLGDPNDLALVLLFPLSFAASLIVRNPAKIDRILGLVGYFAIVSAIIATQSRGGLLGIMSVSGIVGLRVVKSKALVMGVGTVAMLILIAMAGISDRASGGAAESGVDESAMGRIYAWGAAWGMAVSNPLTGVGIDNFFVNYFFYSSHWDGKNHAVHSTWFGVLAETGFLGLAAFIAMVVTMVRSNLRSGRILQDYGGPAAAQALSLALIAGVTGFCVSGTFLTQGFTWPVYILLALTAAISRYATSFEQIAKQNGFDPSRDAGSAPKSAVLRRGKRAQILQGAPQQQHDSKKPG